MLFKVFLFVAVGTTQAFEVRLAAGSSSLEGRLEVHHNGTWGTVCDYGFDEKEARVVCKMLGYTGGMAFSRAHFGAGVGMIWMDALQCSGHESSLDECRFRGWGKHDCRHSEDAGVSCEIPISPMPDTVEETATEANTVDEACELEDTYQERYDLPDAGFSTSKTECFEACNKNASCAGATYDTGRECWPHAKIEPVARRFKSGYFLYLKNCTNANGLAMYNVSVSQPFYNGSKVVFTCNGVAILLPNVTIQIIWKVNDVRILADNKRFSISFHSTEEPQHRYFSTNLTVDPFLYRDKGIYSCQATGGSASSDVASIGIRQVLVLPQVFLSPTSIVIAHRDSSVTFQCILVHQQNVSTVFDWYMDGNHFHSSNETHRSVLEINIVSSVIIACQARNEAGAGTAVQSTVHLKEQSGIQMKIKTCPAQNDNRKTRWAETVANTVKRMLCSELKPFHNYEGTISRICSASGQWRPPLYDCTQKDILDIKSEIEKMNEGIANAAVVSATLEKLATVTHPDQSPLLEGDLREVTGILDSITQITRLPNTSFNTTKSFTNVRSVVWHHSIQYIEHGYGLFHLSFSLYFVITFQ